MMGLFSWLSLCLTLVNFHQVSFAVQAPALKQRLPSSDISNLICLNEIYQVLDQWGEVIRWHQYSSSDGSSVVRGRLKDGDAEVALFIREAQVIAVKTAGSSELVISWKQEDQCQPKVTLREKQQESKDLRFEDRDLDALMEKSGEKKTKGIIYVWSPHMNLSIKGAKEAKSIAAKKGLEFLLLVDPGASSEIAFEIAQKNGLGGERPLFFSSKVLAQFKMLNHFPSVIFYSAGEIASKSRPGYDEPARLSKYLDGLLK